MTKPDAKFQPMFPKPKKESETAKPLDPPAKADPASNASVDLTHGDPHKIVGPAS